MNILAIETSCDETAICYLSVSESESGTNFSVKKNITHTQLEHIEYGGVFPTVAKREHIKNLPIILDQVMQGQEIPDIICVTNGPGLEPALWTGIDFAKQLGTEWNIPVIPVNHMEGHVLSILVPTEQDSFTVSREPFPLPALALLISGGHTELVLVKNIGDYQIIGKTLDDAVGEAFDKVARILGLPYPGGPEVAKLALQHEKDENQSITLPRPMLHSGDYNFSFSGLKTAVLYTIRDIKSDNNDTIPRNLARAVAHEFQESASEVLTKKTYRAVVDFSAQTLIVGGGVSANQRIKESLQEKISEIIPVKHIYFPTKELTGDNAFMIALAGYYKHKKSPDTIYDDVKAFGNLEL